MRNERPPLAPYLRSDAQARILADVLLRDGEHTLSEISDRTGVALNTVQREVDRLAQAAIFTTRRAGRSRLVSANRDYPLLAPLTQIIASTYGPLPLVEAAFAGLAGVQHAYIFGSWAARLTGTIGAFPNDIDVLLVGDVHQLEAHDAAHDLSRRLGRDVNVTTMTAERWEHGADGFRDEVRSRPLVGVA